MTPEAQSVDVKEIELPKGEEQQQQQQQQQTGKGSAAEKEKAEEEEGESTPNSPPLPIPPPTQTPLVPPRGGAQGEEGKEGMGKGEVGDGQQKYVERSETTTTSTPSEQQVKAHVAGSFRPPGRPYNSSSSMRERKVWVSL